MLHPIFKWLFPPPVLQVLQQLHSLQQWADGEMQRLVLQEAAAAHTSMTAHLELADVAARAVASHETWMEGRESIVEANHRARLAVSLC